MPTATAADISRATGTYDVRDLCELLQLSLRSVRRMIAQNAIPGKVRMPNRALRFSRSKVNA